MPSPGRSPGWPAPRPTVGRARWAGCGIPSTSLKGYHTPARGQSQTVHVPVPLRAAPELACGRAAPGQRDATRPPACKIVGDHIDLMIVWTPYGHKTHPIAQNDRRQQRLQSRKAQVTGPIHKESHDGPRTLGYGVTAPSTEIVHVAVADGVALRWRKRHHGHHHRNEQSGQDEGTGRSRDMPGISTQIRPGGIGLQASNPESDVLQQADRRLEPAAEDLPGLHQLVHQRLRTTMNILGRKPKD
jgi:hypothetical protein